MTAIQELFDMDAGELREWLVDKYAWGYSSSDVRLVGAAQDRIAALLNRPFYQIRQEILEDARAMRQEFES